MTYWVERGGEVDDTPPPNLVLRAHASGWRIGEGDDPMPPQRLKFEVYQRCRRNRIPVLAGVVHDSDFAYAVAAASGELSFELTFNPESAEQYGFEPQGASHGSRSIAQKVSEWSQLAPHPLSPSWVTRHVRRRWVFAEDALHALFLELGLHVADEPDDQAFQGAVSLWNSGKFRPEIDVQIDRETAPYVLGSGVDFVGIWSRSDPGDGPIETFPLSDEVMRMQRSGGTS